MSAPRPIVPTEAIDRYLRSRSWSWRGLESGDYGVSVQQVQEYLLTTDAVLFVEAFFVERDSTPLRTWELWPYQVASLRYQHDAIYQCGAEVGKTREIVAKLLHAGICRRGDSLLAAPLDGNLDDHWDMIHDLAAASPLIRDEIDQDATKVKPYRKLVFRNGNRIYFRPAGFDGRAFRGVHAGQFVLLDEAAVVSEEQCFSELVRARKPGCRIGYYSVPKGCIDSPFARLCREAIPVDIRNPQPVPTDRNALFIWPKTEMPPEFWNDERKAKFVRDYGGEDSPGYRRNVLGLWGDPESSIFPWEQLRRCIGFVPGYTRIKIVNLDGHLRVSVHTCRADWRSPHSSADEVSVDALDRILEADLAAEDVIDVVRQHLSHQGWRDDDQAFAGVDFGSTDNPTEVMLFKTSGPVAMLAARVHVRRCTLDFQERLLVAIDDVTRPRLGWGGDSTGGIGIGVEQHLRAMQPATARSIGENFAGFVFNVATTVTDNVTGEPMLSADGQPLRVSNKELATQLLERRVQQASLLLPPDPEITLQWTNHTASEVNGRRVFSKGDDHTIDAARCAALRHRQMTEETCSLDFHFQPVPNSRRASADMEAMF